MKQANTLKLSVGKIPDNSQRVKPAGSFDNFLGEMFYQIERFDSIPPFFISLASSSNHWLFISSTGGLTAGRINAEYALFPYYTVDKITESSENTGAKTIIFVSVDGHWQLWEPFSVRQNGAYQVERRILKNITGTALVFEEHNLDLRLIYRYAWRTGDRYGFVKTSWLENVDDNSRDIKFVDGLQNILPANITSQTQVTFSNLLDAYKRGERDVQSGLGIFSLSSRLTDVAQPMESLRATVAYQVGLDDPVCLLSSEQLDKFRNEMRVVAEDDVRGLRCAYFVQSSVALPAGGQKIWHIVADVNLDQSTIVELISDLRDRSKDIEQNINDDIAENDRGLRKLVESADGHQLSEKPLTTWHHFANVMFNIMRGGVFSDPYRVNIKDFSRFLRERSRPCFEAHKGQLESFPDEIEYADLLSKAEEAGDATFVRLAYSYLPITFSRRHGDPSRPWNRFAINIENPDGSLRLDYEGNWRDIFQNWEALAFSFPNFVQGMIFTFLNATTVDGYNPYRITRSGIDWEKPEPDNPWANIGYWSDHQIIYLQKLIETSLAFHPEELDKFLNRHIFSYANVPYRIKPFDQILRDPYRTIDFDWELDAEIDARSKEFGTDGRLVLSKGGQIYYGSFVEKLLTLLLAKLVNFVPEGGIWMNTQRPEWNDANNALVGRGISVVTLAYLRRFVSSWGSLLKESSHNKFQVNADIYEYFSKLHQVFSNYESVLMGGFNDLQRRSLMQELGETGAAFRWAYYQSGLSGEWVDVSRNHLNEFLELILRYIDQTLFANKRKDHLFHAYNILHLGEFEASIEHLDVMLEGQVAILSAGLLSAEESLMLYKALRTSALYREDQHSYLLYPDKELPGFIQKNTIPKKSFDSVRLFQVMLRNGDKRLVRKDALGDHHFNPDFRNINDVLQVLDHLAEEASYSDIVGSERELIEQAYENTFNHSRFTGRSGTFFAYEGLGSIYWHMVSKLLLAVQETAVRHFSDQNAADLMKFYWDVRSGLGFNKSPAHYGAFPTDPYSHTPKASGARQPGMTGMVKEEILTRIAEVGLYVDSGTVHFDSSFLSREEYLLEEQVYKFWNTEGDVEELIIPAGALVFTFCQVPVIVRDSSESGIELHYESGMVKHLSELQLGKQESRSIFNREGKIKKVVVGFNEVS